MSIATAIQNAQQKVASCYTAISGKGGALPATQNLSNMPTAINSIPSGSTPTLITKTITQNGTYNASSDNADGYSSVTVNVSGGGGYSELSSYQVSNGVASKRTTLTGNEFDNITSVAESGMAYCFYNGSLSGYLNMPNVISIGRLGLNSTFYKCSITSASFGNLISVGEYGLQNSFQNCTNILNVYFDKLNILDNYALFDFLRSATNIENVYFNGLTTSTFSSYNTQFNNMLRSTGKTKTHTLHFPSNLSSTVAGLSGYPTFGGTSGYVTLAFDLPATT